MNRGIRNGTECECNEGWGGINCNMCTSDRACDAFMPKVSNALGGDSDVKGTCYRGGQLVKKSYHMCAVTNQKLVKLLGADRKPEATFSCNATSAKCTFEFWTGGDQSFYCAFDECEFQGNGETFKYECKQAQCNCVAGRTLCGASGLPNIKSILASRVKGPAELNCNTNSGECSFKESYLRGLFRALLGNESISLQCDSSECLHYTEVPGYVVPHKDVSKGLLLACGLSAALLIAIGALSYKYLFFMTREKPRVWTNIPSEDETAKLMAGHEPVSLEFSSIGYRDKDMQILEKVKGSVEPGQVLAIMGGSGAGKTTLLDILAQKRKHGFVNGEITVNGQDVNGKAYCRIIGFVDQDDCMLPTLTVYETVLTSALLRLPKSMSEDTKRRRALETMEELGITGIKDQLIGSPDKRGISGGERRRVSIACELVTSPSILFLDEPTSGLDSFSARKVVERLVHLAKEYNRTVVFTIHQPRTNIVAMFDRLVLLAQGQMVYSGDQKRVKEYFSELGYKCPEGFNVADYMIDITMQGPSDNESRTDVMPGSEENYNDMEMNEMKKANLSLTFLESQAAQDLDLIIEHSRGDVKPFKIVGHERISTWTQFKILSKRNLKNLYRNPLLLLTHYLMAIALGLFCGLVYFNIENDISGFQNRLGLFFFILALFGFSTLTTLGLFAQEHLIFVRERANDYYRPIAYYLAKVLFDLLPLRVFPPILLGLIVYPLAGLTTEGGALPKFLLILVLFNLTSATTCLLIGVLINDTSVSILVGILIMLFSLLFAGLFLNSASTPAWLSWIQYISIFHYAYEALAVNEVRWLMLSERKYGLDIEVPGTMILSTFGFNAGRLSKDVGGLVGILAAGLVAGYFSMSWFSVERR